MRETKGNNFKPLYLCKRLYNLIAHIFFPRLKRTNPELEVEFRDTINEMNSHDDEAKPFKGSRLSIRVSEERVAQRWSTDKKEPKLGVGDRTRGPENSASIKDNAKPMPLKNKQKEIVEDSDTISSNINYLSEDFIRRKKEAIQRNNSTEAKASY